MNIMAAHIGLKQNSSGNFSWMDGTAVDYNGFNNSELPMYTADTECTTLASNSMWNMVKCDCGEMSNTVCNNMVYGYICKRQDGKSDIK